MFKTLSSASRWLLISTSLIATQAIGQINTPSGSGVPFGSNTTYQYGQLPTTLPNGANYGQSEHAAAAYNDWKTNYVEECSNGRYRVKYDVTSETVSEGIAYGMLLAAYAADKDLFDGLWKYYESHKNGNQVMNWKINGCDGTSGQNGATDAELDAAMALLVAEEQWPDDNSVYDYATEASQLINAIWATEIHPSSKQTLNGDAWDKSENCRNPSYQSPAYYKVYKEYTPNLDWDAATTAAYGLINANAHATTGLVGNWSDKDGNSNSCAETTPNEYGYDACRNPWRMATDYIWFEDSNAEAILDKIIAYTKSQGVGNVRGPSSQAGGNGTSHNSVFVSTFAVAGLGGNTTDLAHLSDFYNETVSVNDDTYFNKTLRTLMLFVMTGNFWRPGAATGNSSEAYLEDFECLRFGSYTASGDLTEEVNNPGSADPNTSSKVGQYDRDAASEYDALVLTTDVLMEDVAAFEAGNKKIKMEVYSPGAGKSVNITFRSSLRAAKGWPHGRHSQYTATTTTSGQWETLEFSYVYSEDANTPSDSINEIEINFDPAQLIGGTWYFDNIRGINLEGVDNTPQNPEVVITASPDDELVIGTEATFSISDSANLGSNPTYQWTKNQVDIPGANSPTYSTTTWADEDLFSLKVTSNANCITDFEDESNLILMTEGFNPFILEDFDCYSYSTGAWTVWGDLDRNASNPDQAGNTSSTVAQYTKGGEDWHFISFAVEPRFIDVSDFEDKTRKIKLDVYSDQPGTIVEITLLQSANALEEFPTGRHSIYRAFTTLENQWETLEFNYLESPDASVAEDDVDMIQIAFDAGTASNNVFYFDNLKGPDVEGETLGDCNFVPAAPVFMIEDFECYSHSSKTWSTVSPGVIDKKVENPSQTGNASEQVAMHQRDGENDWSFVSFTTPNFFNEDEVADYLAGKQKFRMDVYSANPGSVIELTFQNSTLSTGEYPAGRHSTYQATTTKTNAWETVLFNLTLTPDPTVPDAGINQIQINFNSGEIDDNVYYFDNIQGPSIVGVTNDECNYTDEVLMGEFVIEDFDCYSYTNGWQIFGELDPMVTNPAPNEVTSSDTVAMYTRAGETWSFVSFNVSEFESLDDYILGTKYITIDVYSENPGSEIQIQMNNAAATAGDYPAGRYAIFTATTTKTNEWERLEFAYQFIADSSMIGSAVIDQMAINFDNGQESTNTYYFDNIAGPGIVGETNGECNFIPAEPDFLIEDFECYANAGGATTIGTFEDHVENPSTTGNTSDFVGMHQRDGENDYSYVAFTNDGYENVGGYIAGTRVFTMDVYSNAPGSKVTITLQNSDLSDGEYPAGRYATFSAVTAASNEWETLTFAMEFVPDEVDSGGITAFEIDQLQINFNDGEVDDNTYYFDNLMGPFVTGEDNSTCNWVDPTPEFVIEDFECYSYASAYTVVAPATIDNMADNPSTVGNSSDRVGMHQRDGAEDWSFVAFDVPGFDDLSAYTAGQKVFTIDVYSDAPGSAINLQLQNKELAGGEYPAGRYAAFTGTTTLSNAWETVILSFEAIADETLTDADVDQVQINFDNGSINDNIYYFDNLMGGAITGGNNTTCNWVDPTPEFVIEDFECYSYASAYTVVAPATIDNMADNPSTVGNSSDRVGMHQRDGAEDWSFVAFDVPGFDDLSAYTAGQKVFTIDVYSDAPGSAINLQLQNKELAGGEYPAGRYAAFTGTTTLSNAWETVTLSFEAIADETLTDADVDQIQINFDNGSINDNIYYFDNLMGGAITGGNNTTCNWVDPSPEFVIEDFECYSYASAYTVVAPATIDNMADNPSTVGNSSDRVGMHQRDGAEDWSFVAFDVPGFDDLSAYTAGQKVFTIDVYSDAPGSAINLQLQNKELAGGEYPAGRYAAFTGTTTLSNAWETVTLSFEAIADETLTDADVDQIQINFDNGSINDNIYYFDNLMGGAITGGNNTTCNWVDPTPEFVIEDFECYSYASAYTVVAPATIDNMADNPSTVGNSSDRVGMHQRDGAEDWSFVAFDVPGFDDLSAYTSGQKVFTIDVYSDAPGSSIELTLQNKVLAGEEYPTGRYATFTGTTTLSNAWETVSLSFETMPDATLNDGDIDQLQINFDAGTINDNIYYFDNLMGPAITGGNNNTCNYVEPVADFLIEDFECFTNTSLTWTSFGPFDKHAENPSIVGNNSDFVAMHKRDGENDFAFVSFGVDGFTNIGEYVDGLKIFTMDVYSAFPGSEIQLIVQNATDAQGEWPVGRHSVYTATTTTTNAWETLEFEFGFIADETMDPADINEVSINFDNGNISNNTYYFDNIMGPNIPGADNAECNFVDPEPDFLIEDFECYTHTDDWTTIAPATINRKADNPSTVGNSSDQVAVHTRDGENDYSFVSFTTAGFEDVSDYLNGLKILTMDVYSNFPGSKVTITMQNAALANGEYPAGRFATFTATTSVKNGWETLKFAFDFYADENTFGGVTTTTVDQLQINFDDGQVNDNTYYFDNIMGPQVTGASNDACNYVEAEPVFLVEDFECHSHTENWAGSGEMDNAAENPKKVGNASDYVGMHTRDGENSWSYVAFEGNFADVSGFLDGTDLLTLDVYSANPGSKVTITLQNAAGSVEEYPAGRLATFSATTTATNEWETLEFEFDFFPDENTFGGVATDEVDIIQINFNDGEIDDNVYYFDNFYGPQVIGEDNAECNYEVIVGEPGFLLEDFDCYSHTSDWTAFSVITLSEENPDASGVNTSASVGKHIRDGENEWAFVSFQTTGFDDVTPFVTGHKYITMDVYSEHPGSVIQITLQNHDLAQEEYPTGRHSSYTATTTADGAWETLEFEYLFTADETMTGLEIDEISINFDNEQINDNTYYFDNIHGPQVTGATNDECNYIEAEPDFLLEDFECISHNNDVTEFGTYESLVENPSVGSNNNSVYVGSFQRDGENDWSFMAFQYDGFDDVQEYVDGTKIITMDVFSEYPGSTVQITMQNHTDALGDYPEGRHSVYTAVTTKTLQWETLKFAYAFDPGSTTASTDVDEIAINFNNGEVDENIYYFDNLMGPQVTGANNDECNLEVVEPVTGFLIEDFECYTHSTSWETAGEMDDKAENPGISIGNSSEMVGMHTRDGENDWSYVSFTTNGFSDAQDFVDEVKMITMDVYSDYPGSIVEITLQDDDAAQDEYPAGRFATFTATTTADGAWETLEFALVNQPDETVDAADVDELQINFDAGSVNSNVYYFDNVKGPQVTGETNDECNFKEPIDEFMIEDFDCYSHSSTIWNYDGDLSRNVTNPDASGINTSDAVGMYTKGGEDWHAVSFTTAGFEDVSDYLTNFQQIHMDVYSEHPGTVVQIILQNSLKSGNEWPIGRHSAYTATTTKTNEWEELVFEFSFLPDETMNATEVNQISINFGEGEATTNTFYFDNIEGPTVVGQTNAVCNIVVIEPGDDFLIEDFECVSHTSPNWSFYGLLNRKANNPLQAGNLSTKVGMHTRPGTDWGTVGFEVEGFTDLKPFLAGVQFFQMDVYSAHPGSLVEITLLDKAKGAGDFPEGRHSVYQATTTLTDEWETLSFALVDQPDPGVEDEDVNQVTINFNNGSEDENTYYFDHIYGPAIVGADTEEPAPEVLIEGDATICPGDAATFFATPIDGGVSPSFTWYVDGFLASLGGTEFTAAGLVDGQVVTAVMDVGGSCANPSTFESNPVTIQETNSLTPYVIIEASDNDICEGIPVTFTATPTGGGAAPDYTWLINGTDAGAQNNQTMSTIGLTDGDVVSVEMTSEASCASVATVTSNEIDMILTEAVQPSVTITGTEVVCSGYAGEYNAVIGGVTDVDYQWKINGVNVGANSPSFSSTGLSTDDEVYVVITANDECASPNKSESNTIVVEIEEGCIPISVEPIITDNKADWMVYPNPSTGSLTILTDDLVDHIKVSNLLGEVVYSTTPKITKTQVDLTRVENGIYIVSVINNGSTSNQKIIINH